MRRAPSSGLGILVALTVAACGGAKPTPETAKAEPATPPATAPEKSADKPADKPPADKPSPADKHAAAEALPHDDPNEKEGPIVLSPLVAKGTPKSAFPKQTVGDHDCLKEVPFSGKHQVDYKTLLGRCGTPTGMLEYVKPSEGRLHITLDKRDHFQIKVQKGYCYRYFAVADDGIKDIDILVLKKGALLATDRTEQPVAIIDTDKLWCADEDMDLDFAVEVDGRGAGGYTFGVWTRPK